MPSVIYGHSHRHNHSTIYNLHICCSRYSVSYNSNDYLIVRPDIQIPVRYALFDYRNGNDSTVIQKQRSILQKLDKIDLPVCGLYATDRWVWICGSIANCFSHIFVNIIFVLRFSAVHICDHVMSTDLIRNIKMVDDGIYHNNMYDDISWDLCVCT